MGTLDRFSYIMLALMCQLEYKRGNDVEAQLYKAPGPIHVKSTGYDLEVLFERYPAGIR
jgi:hypothetical protein